MHPIGRLASHDCPSSRLGGNLHQMTVSIQKPGGGIEQVNQGALLTGEMERRQNSQRHLLVTGPQARAAIGGEKLEPNSADLSGWSVSKLES